MDRTDIQRFYKATAGFEPYDYQVRVTELLLDGKNVVLSVPTGAGKTWASVVPFLYAKEFEIDMFPQKMIYSLPLRTLANSIYQDINKALKNNKSADIVSIQTGEYNDDPYFEKDIVFSTIDQTLSNFLCFPLPLSQRQANINAGALIGSYLVFDEFHLLDPKLSMATCLGMLEILSNLCRVCIMTATLSDDYIGFLKDNFGFDVVSIKEFPNDAPKIKSLMPATGKSVKKRLATLHGQTINANAIISMHKNKTIVICNRVEKAQQIYNDLKNDNRLNINEKNIICLHSRFFDCDRKDKEARLKALFGKGSQENAILVSTQVIEAGMDISCDVMHTEISPVNSFLQRAGRCARFENEYGDIFVYDILDLKEKEKITIETEDHDDKIEIKKLNNKYLPYNKDLCVSTLSELCKYDYIDEKVSPTLVNTILKEEERHIADTITQRQFNKDKIQESWHDCNKSHYRETIRDIQSIDIALIDLDNMQNKTIFPYRYETVSVYKWSFISWLKQVSENKIDDYDWLVAKAEQSRDSVYDFEYQDDNSYILKRLQIDEIKNHYETVFVDNRYFDYNSECGFFVGRNTNNYISPVKKNVADNKFIISYKKDTFYQHNKGLLICFEREFKPRMKFTFHELDKYWGETIDWDYLIKLAICFHDYGKLNIKWQNIVNTYQKAKSGIDSPHEVLAHTDYDERTDKELAKSCGMNNKPPHAGIGAYQVYELLYDTCSEEIARATANAVLKHHSTYTNSSAHFNAVKTGLDKMANLMKQYHIEGKLINQLGRENDLGIMPSNNREWLLYLYIVRILRLSDQKATESLENYYTI